MYHAMFPHMVVQVGHQGHYHTHLVDNNQRSNRGGPNGSISSGPYNNGTGTPIEFLQLFGFDGVRNNVTYNGRSFNGGNNGSNIGNNGNGLNSNLVNVSWRDRNAVPLNQIMGPPPSHIGPRPVTNCSMKKPYWGKTNNRSGSVSRERSGNVAFNEAYSSDSGFSSRSPTPSSQQVSPGSSKSNISSDEDAIPAVGDPASSRSSGNDNKSMKQHESSCHPTYYQPFFQPNNHYIGQLSIHQNCPPHFHQSQQHHSSQGFHHHHHHHNHQLPCHQIQRRSESLTSLGQQGSNNGNQGKRRFHSGRHSPPSMFRNTSRGRRMQTGTVMRSSPPAHSMTGFSAPDRFLQRSHFMYVTDKPSQLLVGDEWDEVSEAIWDKFSQYQQTEEMYKNKMELWKRLFYQFKRLFPRCGLFLVGSTISGFGSNKSDMDMCLLVRHSEMDQRTEAVGHLDRVLKCLRQCSFIVEADLIQAKVPILKFKDADYDLEVDLNCNNAVGIRNTHMLYCYSQMDWRVRALVLVVKLWAAVQGINDAKNMTISSYSLVLMVINFLQCGVSPPILPCLHRLYPGKFQPHTDPYYIDLHEELPPVKAENDQSLGSLLLAFLEYYSHFDFTQDAISVRTASRLPIDECRHARSYKNDPHQWKYLCIEEPFDLTNTAHSVYDHEAFEKIKAVFNNSYQALKETRSLNSIFQSQENK